MESTRIYFPCWSSGLRPHFLPAETWVLAVFATSILVLASSSSCCDVGPPTTRQGMWNSQGAVGTGPTVYHLPIKRNYTSQTHSPHNTAPWFSTLCCGYYKKKSPWLTVMKNQTRTTKYLNEVCVSHKHYTYWAFGGPPPPAPVNPLTLQTRTLRREQLKDSWDPHSVSTIHLSPALQHLTLRSTPSNASHPRDQCALRSLMRPKDFTTLSLFSALPN